MRRYLSQSLILILALLSPLTFSTDKVPNFTPDCEIQFTQGTKSSRIVIVRRCPVSPKAAVAGTATTRYIVSPPSTPHTSSLCIPSSSRAPPLYRSFLS